MAAAVGSLHHIPCPRLASLVIAAPPLHLFPMSAERWRHAKRVCVISFIYPATCGPKGRGISSVAAEAETVFHLQIIIHWYSRLSRGPQSHSPQICRKEDKRKKMRRKKGKGKKQTV